MLKFHVTHVNIHEGSTREKVLGFRGDNSDPMVGLFANVSCSRYATDAIADDHDVFHKNANLARCFIILCQPIDKTVISS
jgi:hypothetical protein